MKNFTASIIFMLSVLTAQLQTFEWLQTVDVDYSYNPEMVNYSSASDTHENSFLFGTLQHVDFYTGSFGELMLRKYDADGNLMWVKILYGLGMAKGSVCDTDGNLYITGKHRSVIDFWGDDTISYAGITPNSFLAKVNPNGDLLWAMNMNDLYPGLSEINDITTDVEGDLYLGISGFPDSYVSKLNPEGDILMEILQTKAGIISGIDIDDSGNVVVTGSCSGNESLFGGENYVTPFGYSMYIAYYDASGSPQWVEFAEDVTCIFPKVKFDSQGNIYWTGALDMASTFGGIQSGGPSWVYDFFVVKVTPSASFEWVFEVPQPPTGDAMIGKIAPLDITSNDNIIIGGFTRNNVDWGNGVVSSTDNYYNIIIMEVSTDGIAQWVKTAGGDYYDNVHSLSVSPLGNIFVAGITGDTVSFDTISHQSDLFFYPYLAKIDYETATGISSPDNKNEKLLVFPNPAADHIYLGSSDIRRVSVFSVDGMLVKETTLAPGTTRLDIEELKSGFYLIRAITSDGIHFSARLIKN